MVDLENVGDPGTDTMCDVRNTAGDARVRRDAA